MEKKLSNQLKLRRVEMGKISQEDLARGVGVSRQTINAIENGKFNPSVKLAMEIAAFLNCKIEEIFYLEEKK